MAHRIHNIKPITVNSENMRLELNTDRLNRNLNNAQEKLDSRIMTSMQPYMPMDKGSFIDRVKIKNDALAGSGEVYAAVGPEGRFLYEGKVMVGEQSRSPWAKKAERKVVTDENLQYSRAGAQSHWFEKAKEVDGDQWKKVVADEMKKP